MNQAKTQSYVCWYRRFVVFNLDLGLLVLVFYGLHYLLRGWGELQGCYDYTVITVLGGFFIYLDFFYLPLRTGFTLSRWLMSYRILDHQGQIPRTWILCRRWLIFGKSQTQVQGVSHLGFRGLRLFILVLIVVCPLLQVFNSQMEHWDRQFFDPLKDVYQPNAYEGLINMNIQQDGVNFRQEAPKIVLPHLTISNPHHLPMVLLGSNNLKIDTCQIQFIQQFISEPFMGFDDLGEIQKMMYQKLNLGNWSWNELFNTSFQTILQPYLDHRSSMLNPIPAYKNFLADFAVFSLSTKLILDPHLIIRHGLYHSRKFDGYYNIARNPQNTQIQIHLLVFGLQSTRRIEFMIPPNRPDLAFYLLEHLEVVE